MRFTRVSKDAKAWRSGDSGNAREMCISARASQEDTYTRSEPQTLAPTARARDPYAVWLAQQQSAGEQAGGEAVRWVYRHPRVTRPAAPDLATSSTEAVPAGALAASEAR